MLLLMTYKILFKNKLLLIFKKYIKSSKDILISSEFKIHLLAILINLSFIKIYDLQEFKVHLKKPNYY